MKLEDTGKTFPEVFKALKEGKKIRRKEWIEKYNEPLYFVKIKEDYSYRSFNVNVLDPEDLLATDWEVI